jgi:hypothetical protein
MTKIISLIFINFGSPKVGAKHELLFNEPASVDQSKSLKWWSLNNCRQVCETQQIFLVFILICVKRGFFPPPPSLSSWEMGATKKHSYGRHGSNGMAAAACQRRQTSQALTA